MAILRDLGVVLPYVRREKIPLDDQSLSSTRMRRKSSCTSTRMPPHLTSSENVQNTDEGRTSYLRCYRYAYFKKLDYFSTECIYSPDAYRGHARVFLKDLEAVRPSAIIDIIHSGEAFEIKEEIKATQKVQREFSRSERGVRSLFTLVFLPNRPPSHRTSPAIFVFAFHQLITFSLIRPVFRDVYEVRIHV